ncbi:TIGR03620 family F420-dependent LLM class oxidoreductase [Mycolicibacterium sp. P9-64]|uniref:TIGR03620 family F420-dependent LLM class oxidoreductase n=1 Tax=Mycolicibacterium sp. P9-64 TaxID=2024612 RepID=UPI0011EDBB1E|nr:TIGR03620 family F420-dependent LLM class oxidoreductase [Mycolicibacterium sp. P9-64]KAA0085617.1 TIGR03620 family F420-dependent LLM class oxidoreductase [Mycolicibacterium sp. P9-64]
MTAAFEAAETDAPGRTRPAIDFASRVGVWWASDFQPLADAQEVAREIEALGYGSLFIGEGGFKEVFTQSSGLLSATTTLVVGTGVANVHARIPAAAEAAGRTINAQYPQRFVLGLGVSHGPLVEQQLGGTYAKPLSTMRRYLEAMDALPDAVEPGNARPARLVAALGPKMIELAGAHADGVHPTLVLPEYTAATRTALGLDKWIVPIQAVALDGTAADRMRWAHRGLEYTVQLPNYRNSLLRQGFDELDLIPGGSDRLVRTMVATEADEAAEAVQRHLDAGADHVLVQVYGEASVGSDDPRPTLRALAAALNFG